MEQLLLPTLIIVALSLLLLCVGIVVKGKFVNSHVSGNKAMAQRGVRCATTQDREARRENPYAVREHSIRNADTLISQRYPQNPEE